MLINNIDRISLGNKIRFIGPLVNSEFYAGWLVVWGQKQQSLPPVPMLINTSDYMYDLGASFNYYMFHGGTNFGYWNGAEITAPVCQTISAITYCAYLVSTTTIYFFFNIKIILNNCIFVKPICIYI